MLKQLLKIIKEKSNNIALLLVLLLGVFLRLYRLDRESLWFDESVTAKAVKMPMAQMISNRLANDHSPLYFLLLVPLVKSFGCSSLVLRLPSALAAILSLLVFLALSRRLFTGEIQILLANLLFAMSTPNIYFGQEARMYALVILFGLLSFYFLWRLQDEERPSLWLGYLLSNIINLYWSSSAIFLLLAQSAFVLYRRRKLPRFFIVYISIFVLYIPMIFSYIAHKGLVLWTWLPPLSKRSLFIFFGDLWHYPFELFPPKFRPWIMPLLAAIHVSFLLAVFRAWLPRKKPETLREAQTQQDERHAHFLVFLWFAVPPLATVLLSLAWKPTFGPLRFLVGITPAFCLMLVFIFQLARLPWLRRLLSGVLILFFAVSLLHYLRIPHKPDWKNAIAYVDEHIQGGELLFSTHLLEELYEYYGRFPQLRVLSPKSLNDPLLAGKGKWLIMVPSHLRRYFGGFRQLKKEHTILARRNFSYLIVIHLR